MKHLRLRSVIGERGQVVIPKPVRDLLGFRPNTIAYFHVEDTKIIIESETSKKVLQEFLTAIKEKKKLPKKIDWDKKYYSQFN